MSVDKKAAEIVFQQFKHVRPRLNRAAIELLCETYEAAKSPEQPDDCISLYKEWRVNHDRPGNMSLTEAAFRAGWEARGKCKS